VRAKSGRLVGNLAALLVVLKGLPLAYSKDLQEDKEPVFDGADTLALCLAAMAAMISGMSIDRDRLAAAAAIGHTTATDLADWLARGPGLPFREAHQVAARAVRQAEERGVDLAELALEDLQAIDPRIDADVYEVLSVARSVASRTSFGGTAPVRVREAIEAARERYL
jgi:argininosuccinate lyase